MSEMLIGWAEVDITPTERVDLYGQYYHRESQGVHSPLSATVLTLDSGVGDYAVMVSLDLASVQSGFQNELRERLRPALPELDTLKVVLNSTHTHNAPGVDPPASIGWLKPLPNVLSIVVYREFVIERLISAIVESWNNRKPGGVRNLRGSASIGHCRRVVYSDGHAEMYGDADREDFMGMESGEDSGFDLLFTFDEEDKPSGAIINLACPSQVMEATYLVSSDFAGETRRLLKERFGSEFKTLVQISAAGCQSPRDLTKYYANQPDFWHEDGVAEIGRRLLHAVEYAYSKESPLILRNPVFQHTVKRINLPKRRASYNDYKKARLELAELEAQISEDEAYDLFCEEVRKNERIPGRPGPYDSKLHHFVLIQNANAVIERYEEQDKNPSVEIEMHVVRIGPIVIATNPFELYLDYGLRIKARSAAEQTFIVQLCAGCKGYLPTERAERLGGYGGLIINGSVGADGGQMLADQTVDAIAEAWNASG